MAIYNDTEGFVGVQVLSMTASGNNAIYEYVLTYKIDSNANPSRISNHMKSYFESQVCYKITCSVQITFCSRNFVKILYCTMNAPTYLFIVRLFQCSSLGACVTCWYSTFIQVHSTRQQTSPALCGNIFEFKCIYHASESRCLESNASCLSTKY